ncbi:uncharacterized protein LOC112494260 isoform X1 [Cephus cinctus]|uniref:Uncharacterized protein LOC112494260 isoform X1 n=1 Tax=Cephus cinctus TaxID=211228 RepID=A0AAJ7RG10_CEPCN|nr:uncharacterized protein LOC112494260 isoform X1 [Cephus cinctus]
MPSRRQCDVDGRPGRPTLPRPHRKDAHQWRPCVYLLECNILTACEIDSGFTDFKALDAADYIHVRSGPLEWRNTCCQKYSLKIPKVPGDPKPIPSDLNSMIPVTVGPTGYFA